MTGQTNETQWYIARDGKQHGPLTDIEMRTFVAHNYLRVTDLIWRPGMAEWQPAPAVFPAVFQPAQQAAPAPAAQPAGQAATAPSASPVTAGRAAPTPSLGSATPAASDFEAASDTDRTPRSLGKRLGIAALALSVIGGGAFALATYREPLLRMVSSSKPADAPIVAAKVEAPAAPAAPVADPVPAPPAAADASAPQPPADPAPAPAAEPQQQAAVTPPPPPAAPSIEGSAIDARLQKIPVWALIKKDYPDWYVGHIAAADKLAAEKKPEAEIAAHLAQGLVSLRRQNADKALAASSDKLKKIAVAFLDHLKSLRTQSVSACYGFISKGETSPAVVSMMEKPEAATALNNQVGAIFEAISEGAKAPVKHDAAVKADYDILIKELAKLGWKEEDLQVFSNPKLLAKREPEQVCKMVQDWFVAHLAVPDKAVRDRLLFETLKPVVSG